MLGLVPALEELWMGLSSPHALSSTFFLAFAAGACDASAKIGKSSQTIPPLCRELKKLHLHYKRWLRGMERKALMPVFGEIVASHHRLKQTGFSLCLSFEEGSTQQVWKVHGPIEKFGIEFEERDTYIGFSSSQGIVSLSTAPKNRDIYFPHFQELEYIATTASLKLLDNYFCPFRSLREVRVPRSDLEIQSNTPLSMNLSFFNTIKVLDIWSIQLAGQTFHKLERFRQRTSYKINPRQCVLTEMPVCTKLVVEVSRLAVLKLPQICELVVFLDGGALGNIWKEHIAVNSNLSGLKLLYFYETTYGVGTRTARDIIQILKSLPALETLIIDGDYIDIPYPDFFKAFVPTGAKETPGIHHSSGEGQISGVLCPKLQSLQIQGINLTKGPGLMHVLEDVITSRAIIGCPLKSFTFYVPKNRFFEHPIQRAGYMGHPDQKWEFIEEDGSCTMEDVPAQKFQIDI